MKHVQNSRPRLYLLDGHALIYRAFYAVQGLTNSKGVPTNAVFGFINALKKLLRDHQPEYMAVCFDSHAKTHRQEQFAEYKINRPPMPDELRPQVGLIKQAVEAFHIPTLEAPGYEADDLVASLAAKFKAKADVVIVTDDKDIFQIIDDQIRVYSPRKEMFLEAKDVKDIWGVGPEFIVDMIGLAGDDSDNIPGVGGVGKVTAAKLINEYGHLEDIYKNVDAMKPSKMKENLLRDRDKAFLSRDLAVLDAQAPADYTLQELKRRDPDHHKLYEMFQDLELRGFLKDLEMPSAPAAQSVAVISDLQVETLKDVRSLTQAAQSARCVMWLLDEDDQGGLFATIHLSCGDHRVWVLSQADAGHLKIIFEDASVAKTVYDLKASLKWLASENIELKGKAFDVMLAAYVLGEGAASLKFQDVLWKYLKLEPSPDRVQMFARMPQLRDVLEAELKDKKLEPLLWEVEQPLSFVLCDMERQGVALDKPLLKDMSSECAEKMASIEKGLYEAAGEAFNINSPKQLAVILFEKLKLPVVKKTKTGYSTDEEVLTQLAVEHALPSMILEYRQYAKLKSTYIDALPEIADPRTGRVHTEFSQIGAETGRLSSRHPNLQNIPIRTELGRKIRQAFVPSEKKWILVSADYSQIELRILAHLSADENLRKAFLKGQDIHKYTAAQIFDVEESAVDYHMRDTAKRVNFGIIYGMSAFGLSKDLDISPGQAKVFIDKYFGRYPQVKAFMDQCIKDCEQNGFVETMLHRRRYLPDIHNKNAAIRQFAQRQAINTPVQGSAADLMKIAMIRIHDVLKEEKMASRMLITVHDEIVFEAPQAEMEPLVKIARREMESALKLDVPVEVNVKMGKNWLEMENLN